MYDKKAVHFGGGAIGRGFVGEFLHSSGYELVFVDVNPDIIDALNGAHKYTVTEIGNEGETQHIVDHFTAINSKSDPQKAVEAIATADIVTCAVGPNILKFIAPLIAEGINKRSDHRGPMAVIACENMINATDSLAGFIKERLSDKATENLNDRARFANCAVDRIVPQQTGSASLDVKIEHFHEWCVEVKPFKDIGAPKIEGVHYVEDLAPYIERKLFTVNTAHATAAYLGYAAGKEYIHEAMADSRIRDVVRGALRETSTLIVNKHHIPKDEQRAYADKIVTRISNPALQDRVERVGRAPLRKLSRNERLIAPARQLADEDEEVRFLLTSIDKAFRFQNVEGDDESRELANSMENLSAADVLKTVCGITKSDKIYPRLLKIVEDIQESGKLQSKAGGYRPKNALTAGI